MQALARTPALTRPASVRRQAPATTRRFAPALPRPGRAAPPPPAAALAIDEDVKKGLFVAGFGAALYKNVELTAGTVLQYFSYLIVAAAAAKLFLGIGGATGDVGGLIAPAALAVSHLSLYDVGTSIVCLFGVVTAQALGLGVAGTWGAIATLAAAAYKGYAAQWLTAGIAAGSAKALYESGFKLDKAGLANGAILAATAFVVAKDLYGPWVTVGALHATAMAALGLGTTVLDRLT